MSDLAPSPIIPFSELMRVDRLIRSRAAEHGVIYFVGGDDEHHVKIGFTSNLSARLQHLQTGMVRPIRLLGTVEGTPFDEADLHRRFARYHARGEWFRLAGPIAKKIARLSPALRGAGGVGGGRV